MARSPLIYFSRHGQTDWNVSRRIQGQVERDINAQGRAEADRNGHKLKELIGAGRDFAFVASPLRRTRETMERIRKAMGLDPAGYRTDLLLMELNFGDWQGFTEEEIAVDTLESIAARLADKWNFLPPGSRAESYAMLAARVRQWVESVSQKTVCVTHGGCLRAIFHLYGHLPEAEAANVLIPQDRILHFEQGKLTWL